MGIKILLLGKKSSGKTTVANYLTQKYNFKEYTFAEPLKQICKQIFNLSDKQLYEHEFKEQVDEKWRITPRVMFQTMGDLIRDQLHKYFSIPENPKIFVQILANKITDDENVVISDGRLQDEVEWFKSLPGGIIINIKRDSLIYTDTHKTETLEYDGDFTIQNNGTIQQLQNSIDEIMSKCL